MRLEEQTWRNKQPIRIHVLGSLGPCGEQQIEMSVIYERQCYAVGYRLPPSFMPQDARRAHGELRRAWRSFREGVRRLMHGDNFRDRWAVERIKRDQLQLGERTEGRMLGLFRVQQARENFERAADGEPLDPEEAALLAALRRRGLNELADMALHCFGESYGHAPTALRELLNATRLGWTTGVGFGGAGAGGLGSEGVAFASTGGIGGGGGGGAGPGVGSSDGVVFASSGGIGGGGSSGTRCSLAFAHDALRPGAQCPSCDFIASATAVASAGHYGPVGTEPNRCNWMMGGERCSLPYPHEGLPHQIAAKEAELVP